MLTELSVVDACFWDLFRAAGATSLAGVPYTFDLLDRVGFADIELPTLRYVTQAGGRLAPDQVRRYAELGQRRGFDLFVMYGADRGDRPDGLPAARTSPPAHPRRDRRPGAGRLVPAPSRPGAADPDCGELVYSGAERDARLRHGRPPTSLSAAPSTSCAPATWPAAPRPGSTRSSVASTGTPSCSACASTSTGSSAPSPLPASARPARPVTTASWWPSSTTPPGRWPATWRWCRDWPPDAAACPAARCRCGSMPELPVTGNGKVDYRAVAG